MTPSTLTWTLPNVSAPMATASPASETTLSWPSMSRVVTDNRVRSSRCSTCEGSRGPVGWEDRAFRRAGRRLRRSEASQDVKRTVAAPRGHAPGGRDGLCGFSHVMFTFPWTPSRSPSSVCSTPRPSRQQQHPPHSPLPHPSSPSSPARLAHSAPPAPATRPVRSARSVPRQPTCPCHMGPAAVSMDHKGEARPTWTTRGSS